MRFLRPAYLGIPAPSKPGWFQTPVFWVLLKKRVRVDDDFFTTSNFLPGGGGEGKLSRCLIDGAGLG